METPRTFITAVINVRGVSTNKSIIYFIAMQTYKELKSYIMHRLLICPPDASSPATIVYIVMTIVYIVMTIVLIDYTIVLIVCTKVLMIMTGNT